MSSGTFTTAASYQLASKPPSMLYNNLCIAYADNTIVYASDRSVVRYAPTSNALHKLGSYDSAITSIHAVPPSELTDGLASFAPLFMVTGATFADLYVSGRLAHSIAFQTALSSVGSATVSAVSTVTGSTLALCACGTTSGCLIFTQVDLTTALNTGEAPQPLQAPVNAHERTAISAVDIRHSARNVKRLGALAASGDVTGRVVLWNYDYQPFVVIPGAGHDCITSVKICNEYNLLVALAYGSGKINVHSAVTGSVETSICAHSRWVTGLDYAPVRGGLLASCAEDSVVSVWTLAASSASAVEETKTKDTTPIVDVRHVGSSLRENWLPTGVAVGADGTTVTVACYDNPTITVIAIP